MGDLFRFGAVKIDDSAFRFIITKDDQGFLVILYSPITEVKFTASLALPLDAIHGSFTDTLAYHFKSKDQTVESFSGDETLLLQISNNWVEFKTGAMDQRDFLIEELIQDKKRVKQEVLALVNQLSTQKPDTTEITDQLTKMLNKLKL
eukprot:TRINITY_DN4933_c0_g1_i1.p1 TRINITY_DN4933_c0_g1~~TRINITY_DN4933_c0_g1_i1.p1  ORF type:complete len:155 (-),score=29.92 TRINITY_DN4933_c0_g1_i1:27-470(-)